MPYLRYRDYAKTIQDASLTQVVGSDDHLRILCEQAAQATAIELLVQKYDVTKEMTDTLPYSRSTTYTANSRFELNFPEYVATNSYTVNALTVHSGNAYICTTNTTGPFNPAHWQLLGEQYDMFFATLPKAEFYYKGYYKAGTEVFWKDKVYTAQMDSPILGHDGELQYGYYQNIPYPNIFPDDPVNGVTWWGVGVPYSVAPGTLPTDATKFTKGDNRNASLVRRLVQICLFYLHDRIAPRNIPNQRKEGYEEAMDWLNQAKTGEITVALPLLQPKIDGRIRWGSAIKRENGY